MTARYQPVGAVALLVILVMIATCRFVLIAKTLGMRLVRVRRQIYAIFAKKLAILAANAVILGFRH